MNRLRIPNLIFIVGMMGAGKTTVGRRFAERLDLPFLDLDDLVEGRVKLPVAEIFSSHGEFNFRCCEAQVLRDVPRLCRGGGVVATGGGAPMHFDGMSFMRSHGLVVYLEASSAELIARLEQQRAARPLLARDDWQEFIADTIVQREPVYKQAHVSIEVDGRLVGDVLDTLVAQLPQIKGH